MTVHVKGASTQPKIMIIYKPPYITTSVSAYGETIFETPEVFRTMSMDYLRQFDLFVTHSEYDWKDYPDVISLIGTLVDEGKSLLVEKDSKFDDPANAWVSIEGFGTPSEPVEFEIVPSNLTLGVRSIKAPAREGYLLLYGGYPLVRSPKKVGWPDPPGALAVYGYYGAGKFVVLSLDLFMMSGDVPVLFSNIMYWLTNREAPPPPSVVELDWKIAEINNSINSLYSKLLVLNNSINQLYAEIPQLGEITNQLNQTQQQLAKLIDQVNSLSKEITNLNFMQNLVTYLAIFAFPISVASLVIAIRRKQK
jgi:hypothetical protein